MKEEPLFKIGADNFDAAKIVEEIRNTVEKKMQDGTYGSIKISQEERDNLSKLVTNEQYLAFYLEALREAIIVDISDFEIVEKRKGLGGILVPLKKAVWKILKFYTYRMWSQQNQVNGLLLVLLETLDQHYRGKIAELEKRLSDAESGARSGR